MASPKKKKPNFLDDKENNKKNKNTHAHAHPPPLPPHSLGRTSKTKKSTWLSVVRRGVLNQRNHAGGEPPSLENLEKKAEMSVEEDETVNGKHAVPYHPFHSPLPSSDFAYMGLPQEDEIDCGIEKEMPPYDPKTNYMSPRPQFLRYRPHRNLDLLFMGENPNPEPENSISAMEVDEDGPETQPQFDASQDEELVCLERQMNSIDLAEGEINNQQQRQSQQTNMVFAGEAMSRNCTSTEPVMPEEAVGKPTVSQFEPKLNIEQGSRWFVLMKGCIIMVLVLGFACMAILASGSPGLLPSGLLDNPLATAWNSSKTCAPVREALRGARGFWKHNIVQPKHFGIDLEKGDNGRGLKKNWFWLHVKEPCLELLKRFGLNTNKVLESLVSKPSSMPKGLYKQLHVEDKKHEENSFHITEEADEIVSAVGPFEEGLFEQGNEVEHDWWEDRTWEAPYFTSEEHVVEEQTGILDASNSSLELQYIEDNDSRTQGFDIIYGREESYAKNENLLEVPVDDKESAPDLNVDFLDYLQDTEKVSVDAHKKDHDHRDDSLDHVPLQELIIDGSDESESDYRIYKFNGIDLSFLEREVNNEIVPEDTQKDIHTHNNLEFVPSEELMVDIRFDESESDFSIPDLFDIDSNSHGIKDTSELQSFEISSEAEPIFSTEDSNKSDVSINRDDEAHDPALVNQFGSFPSELQSFKISSEADPTFSTEDSNKSDVSINGDDLTLVNQFGKPELESQEEYIANDPVLTDQSKILDFETLDETKAAVPELEKSMEVASSVVCEETFSHLDILSTRTSIKSLKTLLLRGIAFVFTVTVLCAYMSDWYRKILGHASLNSSSKSDPNVDAKTIDLTEDPPSTILSRREKQYSQGYHPNLPEIISTSENPSERSSFVPSVQLLNEYLPSEVVSTSEKKKNNTWTTPNAQWNSFYTPDEKSIKKGDPLFARNQENAIASDLSIDDSSYERFTSLMKEDVDREQVMVTSVRRSNRIRNQARSPTRSPPRMTPRSPTRSPPRSPSRRRKTSNRGPALDLLLRP